MPRLRPFPKTFIKTYAGYTSTTNYNCGMWTKFVASPCTITGVNVFVRPGATATKVMAVRLSAFLSSPVYTATTQVRNEIVLAEWVVPRVTPTRYRVRIDVPDPGYHIGLFFYDPTVLSKALEGIITLLPWEDGVRPKIRPGKPRAGTIITFPPMSVPVDNIALYSSPPINSFFLIHEVLYSVDISQYLNDTRVLISQSPDSWVSTNLNDPRIAGAGNSIFSPCSVVSGETMHTDGLGTFLDYTPFRPYTNVRFKPAYIKLLVRGTSIAVRNIRASFSIEYLSDMPWWQKHKLRVK